MELPLPDNKAILELIHALYYIIISFIYYLLLDLFKKYQLKIQKAK